MIQLAWSYATTIIPMSKTILEGFGDVLLIKVGTKVLSILTANLFSSSLSNPLVNLYMRSHQHNEYYFSVLANLRVEVFELLGAGLAVV
jgi:hypothetical protein